MPFYPYKGTVRRLRVQVPELDAAVTEIERQLQAVTKLLKLIISEGDEVSVSYAKLAIQELEGGK